MHRETEKKLQAVTLLISGGWSASDACETTGLAYATFRKYGGAATERPSELRGRDEKMVALYREGKTLEEIGLAYGITRERVRQVISSLGVTSKQGGGHLRVKTRDTIRVEKRRANRDAKTIKTHGCGFDAAIHLNDGLNLYVTGSKSHCFIRQRISAGNRDIGWEMTFPEWCKVWSDSGKWDLRGRGKGHYCMSRIADSGPYSVGNVRICSIEDNIREGYIYRPASDRQKLNGHLSVVRARQAEVLALNESGKSIGEIALALGLKKQYVSNCLTYARRQKKTAAQMLQAA